MNREINLAMLRAFYGDAAVKMTFEQLIREVILRSFDTIKTEAEKHQVCKRKAVGCTILNINLQDELITHYMAINGPSGKGNECRNVVGACGCSHSEPRAIMKFLKRHRKSRTRGKTIMLCTYSPCVNCSNIVIDSDVIDVLAYEIRADYWANPPHNADALIERSPVRLWTKAGIENDLENKLLKEWLFNDKN